MSMWVILAVSHLDKNDPFLILRYDIDLSSLDLIITRDDLISTVLFEILDSNILSGVSYGTTGRSDKMIVSHVWVLEKYDQVKSGL